MIILFTWGDPKLGNTRESSLPINFVFTSLVAKK